MKTQRLKQIGTHECPAFVEHKDGSGSFEILKVPTYEPSPEGKRLRELRCKLHLTLRQAAEALGCSVVEVGELERGISEPAPPATWDEAWQALKRAAGGGR